MRDTRGGIVLFNGDTATVDGSEIICVEVPSIQCYANMPTGERLTCFTEPSMRECPKTHSCDGRIFVPIKEYIEYAAKRLSNPTTKE